MQMVTFNKKTAFTLIELLVSISIIATLTAILLPNFMGARERAKDSQKVQDLNNYKNALRLYYNDNNKYPDGDGIDVDDIPGLSTYIQPTNVGYTYTQTDGGDGFLLSTALEVGQGDEDLNSQIKCGTLPDDADDKIFVICAK